MGIQKVKNEKGQIPEYLLDLCPLIINVKENESIANTLDLEIRGKKEHRLGQVWDSKERDIAKLISFLLWTFRLQNFGKIIALRNKDISRCVVPLSQMRCIDLRGRKNASALVKEEWSRGKCKRESWIQYFALNSVMMLATCSALRTYSNTSAS